MEYPQPGVPYYGVPAPAGNQWDRMHMGNMQRDNWQMAGFRTKYGGWDQHMENAWPQLPIPWKQRGVDTATPFLDIPDSQNAWQKPFLGDRIWPASAPWLDTVTDLSKLKSTRERKAWVRLQDAKEFFETGGATPGTTKRWKYRRILGYGGNGLACHFRIHETDPIETHQDVAVKVQLRSWQSQDLRLEKQLMRKLARSAHVVQEVPRDQIGKPARQNIKQEWYYDDSSEYGDSSGDEDTPPQRPANRRQRKARTDLTPVELINKLRRWNDDPDAQVRQAPTPPPDSDRDRKDFIVLEFLENGDLRNMIAKVSDMGGTFPNRVLWGFWLCLVKQCIALAYYPRKFHPDRMRTKDTDLDEIIPPQDQRWRRKRMVHFDFDPCNIFVGNVEPGSVEHRLVPKLKLADFGLACEVKEQKRDCYYVNRRRYAKFPFYAPEQFTPEWDFLPAERNGTNVIKEPVAGNFGVHTNIWCAALTMWCLITLHYPLQPPIAGFYRITREGKSEQILTYGNVLFNGQWDQIDVNLRGIVNWCMAHDPSDRPSLEHLLRDAIFHASKPPDGNEDDRTVHNWLQNEVLSAQSLQQEIRDTPVFAGTN